MDNVRGTFAGAAMALGLLVACVGLAVLVIDDTGWALAVAGVVCLCGGAAAAISGDSTTQPAREPAPMSGSEGTVVSD